MPRVVHIVMTEHFAGVERYVCDVAAETARRDWDVAVIGGNPDRMLAALGDRVWGGPGATAVQALRSVRRSGRSQICHAHMTAAEAISVATRPLHRGAIVSTRHFAAKRGNSRAGRI